MRIAKACYKHIVPDRHVILDPLLYELRGSQYIFLRKELKITADGKKEWGFGKKPGEKDGGDYTLTD